LGLPTVGKAGPEAEVADHAKDGECISFKWQDIPRDVSRQMVLDRSWAARTWINGKTTIQMDVPIATARELYNKNWDGCRDLWKAIYRARKHPGQTLPFNIRRPG
jgi:hypothetical protein